MQKKENIIYWCQANKQKGLIILFENDLIDFDVIDQTQIFTEHGVINILHEITLGEILVFTAIALLLVLQLIKTLVRR